MLKIIAFYIITLKTRLYVRLVILLTDGRQLLDKIISLSGAGITYFFQAPDPLGFSEVRVAPRFSVWCFVDYSL
jgi:hypothetical protein